MKLMEASRGERKADRLFGVARRSIEAQRKKELLNKAVEKGVAQNYASNKDYRS